MIHWLEKYCEMVVLVHLGLDLGYSYATLCIYLENLFVVIVHLYKSQTFAIYSFQLFYHFIILPHQSLFIVTLFSRTCAL